MSYSRRCTLEEVIEAYGDTVSECDCARAFITLEKMEIKGTFFEQMYFIRVLLNNIGYQIPFRVGGFRRIKK
jgi:hypothetical protein